MHNVKYGGKEVLTEDDIIYILIKEYHSDISQSSEIMGVTDSKEKVNWWMEHDHPNENIWHLVEERKLNVFGDWWK